MKARLIGIHPLSSNRLGAALRAVAETGVALDEKKIERIKALARDIQAGKEVDIPLPENEKKIWRLTHRVVVGIADNEPGEMTGESWIRLNFGLIEGPRSFLMGHETPGKDGRYWPAMALLDASGNDATNDFVMKLFVRTMKLKAFGASRNTSDQISVDQEFELSEEIEIDTAAPDFKPSLAEKVGNLRMVWAKPEALKNWIGFVPVIFLGQIALKVSVWVTSKGELATTIGPVNVYETPAMKDGEPVFEGDKLVMTKRRSRFAQFMLGRTDHSRQVEAQVAGLVAEYLKQHEPALWAAIEVKLAKTEEAADEGGDPTAAFNL